MLSCAYIHILLFPLCSPTKSLLKAEKQVFSCAGLCIASKVIHTVKLSTPTSSATRSKALLHWRGFFRTPCGTRRLVLFPGNLRVGHRLSRRPTQGTGRDASQSATPAQSDAKYVFARRRPHALSIRGNPLAARRAALFLISAAFLLSTTSLDETLVFLEINRETMLPEQSPASILTSPLKTPRVRNQAQGGVSSLLLWRSLFASGSSRRPPHARSWLRLVTLAFTTWLPP